MRTAAIQNGVVIDIEDVGPSPGQRGDGLTRYPCPEPVEIGWTFIGYDTPQPTVTDAQVAEESYVFDAETLTVTRTWTVRPKTADELRKTWPCLEFIARFTPDERAAVRAYAPDLMEMLLAAHEIESDNPLTIYGLGQLVAAGIITESRKGELLQ